MWTLFVFPVIEYTGVNFYRQVEVLEGTRHEVHGASYCLLLRYSFSISSRFFR